MKGLVDQILQRIDRGDDPSVSSLDVGTRKIYRPDDATYDEKVADEIDEAKSAAAHASY